MKLAIGYSTKDQVELTMQTFLRIYSKGADIYWADGSVTEEGKESFSVHPKTRVTGGADAAIAWKLSTLLNAPENYTHIGLIENDCLLDPDWYEPTMELFEKGKADGLEVGAVSPRSYVDRVLIQREGYAVMHNLGAGAVVFTRDAAEIVLRSFRTHWWLDNRRLFAQLGGIDLATYACFRGQEQFVTTDWAWEAQLARYGLASLALTPAKCRMIGQVPSLAEQGLELTTADNLRPQNDFAFETYQANLAWIRQGKLKLESPGIIHRDGAGMTFFPHQLGYLAGFQPWQGTMELKWTQGFGPFAYRAGKNPDGVGGASVSLRVSGSLSFLVTGGSAGARVDITDTRSGFRFNPDLPPEGDNPISIQVPGGPVPRQVELRMDEGAVFYGLQTAEPQLLDATFRFDWSQLPEAK